MIAAFFSYSRHDDEASGGLLSKIRAKLETDVQSVTGDIDLTVFQDVDDIKVGDDWSAALRDAIDGAAYFVPILTPMYFSRPACRSELETWLSNYRTEEQRNRILPIRFIGLSNKPGAANGERADILRTQLEKIQYADFIRFNRNSTLRGELGKQIFKLAEVIAQGS